MLELKRISENADLTEKMNRAFTDLRADFELDLIESEEKILELESLHVDYNNNLSNLIDYSKFSSGLVSGLRGTGKTHLFLLARNSINNNLGKNSSVAFYINLKRLSLPENYSKEQFNRLFSAYLFDNISKQLVGIMKKSTTSDSLFTKLRSRFIDDNKETMKKYNEVLELIAVFRASVLSGNEQIQELTLGTSNFLSQNKDILELENIAKTKLGIDKSSVELSTKLKAIEEKLLKKETSNTYLRFLNINEVRANILKIKELIGLSSITFYIDEWEKAYEIVNLQKYLAEYINVLNDTPLYFWIGYVPNRGGLHQLSIGGDLQHVIDLDDNLKIELSTNDELQCIDYFKKFIEYRLGYYFEDCTLNSTLLFSKADNLKLLIYGSMGNTRDFGTILLNAWNNYSNYRSSSLKAGRPYNSLSQKMIIEAIIEDGKKKVKNIRTDKNAMEVWKNIEEFAFQKKSSHFCIVDSSINEEVLNRSYFSSLIYHRLISLRKPNLSSKYSTDSFRLNLYAISYACIYEKTLISDGINFIKDKDEIHNRVRRYIYEPSVISNYIELKDGNIINCKNPTTPHQIDTKLMIDAVKRNTCPFCGSELR